MLFVSYYKIGMQVVDTLIFFTFNFWLNTSWSYMLKSEL